MCFFCGEMQSIVNFGVFIPYFIYFSGHNKRASQTTFINVVRKYEHITELTPEIMHELIEKIVVHAPDKSSGHRTRQIDIYYRFDVAVSTVVADSINYDKKRKAT